LPERNIKSVYSIKQYWHLSLVYILYRIINNTVVTLSTIICERGISMARISKNELIRLQKKFETDARIGEEFGITRQAVHQLRKKYGIISRTAGNPERNKEMVTLRAAGRSVESIAKKFKLSIPQTYRILKENITGAKKARKKASPKKTAKKAVKKVAKKKAAPKKAAKKVVKKVAKKPAKKKAAPKKAAPKKAAPKKAAKKVAKKPAKKKAAPKKGGKKKK
jgi:hypothetical protein